jgi:hypothetical protein
VKIYIGSDRGAYEGGDEEKNGMIDMTQTFTDVLCTHVVVAGFLVKRLAT